MAEVVDTAVIDLCNIIPLFYLHTAAEVLAIPETISASEDGHSVVPHSCRVTLVSIPSLEEGVGAASRRAVVTLIIAGANLQSRVVASGEILQYVTALYGEAPTDLQQAKGVIFVRVRVDNAIDSRRSRILSRLNFPDYEVVEVETEITSITPIPLTTRKTVYIVDGAMLRIPVREIVRHFSSLFSSSDNLIAPNIALFSGFKGVTTLRSLTVAESEENTSTPSLPLTTFISMPNQAFSLLSAQAPQQQALLNNLPPLTEPEAWQVPIKMSYAGWTVIGVLWALLVMAFGITIGINYSWYLKQVF